MCFFFFFSLVRCNRKTATTPEFLCRTWNKWKWIEYFTHSINSEEFEKQIVSIKCQITNVKAIQESIVCICQTKSGIQNSSKTKSKKKIKGKIEQVTNCSVFSNQNEKLFHSLSPKPSKDRAGTKTKKKKFKCLTCTDQNHTQRFSKRRRR